MAPYRLVFVDAGLGEQDQALGLLERAYDERPGSIYGIKGSFLFTTLRGHPRFTRLLRRLHLT